MAELVSAREFARRAEVDERQVRRALSRGLLNRGADGLLDTSQLDTRWRSPNARTRERGADKADVPRGQDGLAAALLAKERALGGLRRLELEQKSNALIPLDLAQRVLFECARSVRNDWLNWPARVSPHLAASLGVDPDALMRVLTTAVRQQLEGMGEPQPDFGQGQT